MSNTQSKPKRARLSPPMIGAGILVVALGFGLPMLTPAGGTPVPAPTDSAKQPLPSPMPPPDATGLGASLLKLAVGMVVVCGLCVLVARWVGPKPAAAPGTMDVLASIAIAQCVLHLVRAGDRRLLIGTDIGGVKTILELPGPDPEAPPEPPLATAAESPAPPEAAVLPPSEPVPADTPTQEKLLQLLLRLRARTDASSPG